MDEARAMYIVPTDIGNSGPQVSSVGGIRKLQLAMCDRTASIGQNDVSSGGERRIAHPKENKNGQGTNRQLQTNK